MSKMTKAQAIEIAEKIINLPDRFREDVLKKIDMFLDDSIYTETDEDLKAIDEALANLEGELHSEKELDELLAKYKLELTGK